MPDNKLLTGLDAGLAICKHFGLKANQVKSDYRIEADPCGLTSINLTISLTPDDLAGIARAAGAEEREGEQGPELVNLAPPSRVYTGDETRDILRRYAAGTKAETQALTIKVDASEAAETLRRYGVGFGRSEIAALTEDVRQLRKELNERMERYAQMHYGCAAAALRSVEAIQGEALAIEPDPRLDEIVSLLKRLVDQAEGSNAFHAVVRNTVSVVEPGQ